MQAVFETAFDALYLISVIAIGITMIAKRPNRREFRHMWLTIVLSFGFYIPVVLWADAVPMIGMLMVPKTCAYVWTVLIGYRAMQKSLAE